nr:BON domain-containing protein [Methylomarinum sp. Ch1-1]MDP4519701.1 BON domain-containing protein [Methylomarinum sp. Ch1-1]
MKQKTSESEEYLNRSIDSSKEKLESVAEDIEAAQESVADKAETAGEYVDDALITAKVKAAFLDDPLLNALNIEVTTVNGVVTLSGTVDSEASIGKAVELASSQENVKSVETDLIVNLAPSSD